MFFYLISFLQQIMQKLKKKKISFFLELEIKCVRNFNSTIITYVTISCLHPIIMFSLFYQALLYKQQYNLPYSYIFIVSTSFFGGFILLGILALNRNILLNFFGQSLLFFQAIIGIYIQLLMKCHSNETWCEGNIKYQITTTLICIIIIISITILRTFFYYPFHDTQHILSMKNGYFTILFTLYKVVISFINNYSTFQSNSTLHHAAMFFATIVLFIFTYNSYFNHIVVKIFWNILISVLIWTACLVYIFPNLYIFSMNSTFDEISAFKATWFYSTPFIIFFSYSLGKRRSWQDFFTQYSHKIKQKKEFFSIISYLVNELNAIKKSQLKNNNPNYKKLLELMNSHSVHCIRKYCQIKTLSKEEPVTNHTHQRLQLKILNKNIQLCFQTADEILENLQNRYPNDLEITIFCANFSFEAFKIKQKALFLCSQYALKDIQYNLYYSLYYLKQKIQFENIAKEDFNHQFSQTSLSEFQHNIEVSVSMLAEFWYLLSDPKCNLKKLYDLANVLFPLKIQVDNMWNKIQSSKNIRSYNLYAKYLIDLFNDKDRGLKLLQEAKKIDAEIRNRKEIQIGLENNNNIADENGVIFLELDESKSGTMYQTNLAAEKIFGYNKGELMNRKVNDVMPKTYSMIHDKILQNYQQTGKAVIMNKQRMLWGKSKSGYLFPLNILIKPVKNYYSEKTEMYASIKKELWLKEIGMIVINQQCVITDISASIINIFPTLNLKSISKKKINIIEILPKFQQLRSQLQITKTTQIEIKRKILIDSDQYNETLVFNLSIQQIKITFAGVIGYLLKFVKSNSYVKTQCNLFNNTQINPFSMILTMDFLNLECEKIKWIGASNVKADIQEQLMKSTHSLFYKKKELIEIGLNNVDRINYAENIKVKRLCSNIIREKVNQSETESVQKQDLREQQEELNASIFTIRSSELSSIISKEKGNQKIKFMKGIVFFIMVISIVIITVQYMQTLNNKSNLQSIYSNIKLFNQLYSQVLYMKSYVDYSILYTPSQQNITWFLSQITELANLLNTLSYTQTVNLTYSDNSSQSLFLQFAINKLITSSNILESANSTLNILESTTFFVSYNSINNILNGIQQQKVNIINTLDTLLNLINFKNMIFILAAFPILLLMIILINFLLLNVLQKKAEILQVFFQIPRKTCKNLQKECQRFIQKFATSENQDVEIQSIDQEDYQIQENSDSNRQSKRKKRSIEGQDKTKTHFLILTLAFLVYLNIFHVVVLTYNQIMTPVLKNSFNLIRLISSYEPYMVQSLNGINSLLILPNMTIFDAVNSQDSQRLLKASMKNLIQLNHQYETTFYLNKLNFDSNFISNYNSIMFGTLCDSTQCFNNGLNLLYSGYIDYIQAKYNNYNMYTITHDMKLFQNLTSQTSFNQQNKTQSIMKRYFRQITDHLNDSINIILDTIDTNIFAVLVTLIIVNVFIYTFGWLKFLTTLQKKIMATQYILTFIPINQINKNYKIANYIKKEILEKK